MPSRYPTAEATNLLKPREVASMFRVNPKTVTRWEQQGLLRCIRTLGGHRRYLRDEVLGLLSQWTERVDDGY